MIGRTIHSHDPRGFSEAALALLKKSGWTPAYHVPVDAYLAAYRDEKLEMPPAVRRFLEHFGGLVIQYKTATKQDDILEFRAERAARGSGHGTLEGYEEMAHERLSPVGSYSFGLCMLLMDARGRVFGGTEWSLVFLGPSGEAAIERILTGSTPETVAEDVVDEAQRPRKKKTERGE
jgi:hypothetical protein